MSSTAMCSLPLPASWTIAELEAVRLSGATVQSRTPGLNGTIVEVRLGADGNAEWVVLALPFPGRAVLRATELTAPPRLATGARVRTPFGRGRVVAARAWPGSASASDYEVELLDVRLAGWTVAAPLHARGFITAADVQLRAEAERTAEEVISDADALRDRGNNFFKAGDFVAALADYTRSSEVLASYRPVGLRKLDVETRRAMIDSFIKSLGNSATAYLKQTPPDYEKAVTLTSEALEIDGDDVAKQRAKNLRRRGMAHFALKAWARAADDLKSAMAEDKAFANDAETREKYTEARAAARREAERERQTWQGAFAKLGSNDEGAASSGEDSRGVRFSSPSSPAAGATTGYAGARATPLSVNADGDDADDSSSPAEYKRTMFAGHTPHPKKRGAPGAGGAAAAAAAGAAGAGGDTAFGFSTKRVGAGGVGGVGTATEIEEEEDDIDVDEDEGSLWPWVLGGAAALAIGVGAAYMLSRRRR